MSAPTPALRILAAVANGAVLVGRPRGVVHVHAGALTRSGGAVPAVERPHCGARTRRLRVLAATASDVAAATAGRRFCRTCVAMLPARLGGGSGALVTREDWVAAYGDLTAADLQVAATWARSVEETYQVVTVLMQVHGPKPVRPTTDEARAVRAAYDAAEARRRRITTAAMTDDERAAVQEARDTELFNRRRVEKNRRRDIAVARAQDRALAGGYVMPRDRDLLDIA